MMRVERDGEAWVVKLDGGTVIGRFASNAEAWRFVDRAVGEPVSAAEKRAQFTHEVKE